MTDDLAAFLLVLVEADEQVARAVETTPWRLGDSPAPNWDGNIVWRTTEQPDDFGLHTDDEADAAHIARHDPDRVLADVAVKRQIIEHQQRWAATLRATPEGWTSEGATAYRMAMEWTLRLLALPFADHPDYDESWRP